MEQKPNEEVKPIQTSEGEGVEGQPLNADKVKEADEVITNTKQDSDDKKEADATDEVEVIKQSYEEKIATLQAEHETAIKKRDAIIKQLIKGEGEAKPQPTIADKINAERNFKKW